MAPLIPRIESAKVGSKSLAYLIRPGSDFRGDRIRCDTGVRGVKACLPQHTRLRLKVKALKARVHCVCRRYSTIETETERLEAYEAVADLGGVRRVQMHPPLADSNVFLRT